MERRESERTYLRNLHDKYYGKKKRRERIRDEKEKQLWLFNNAKKEK
jgi:hypothetical protein